MLLTIYNSVLLSGQISNTFKNISNNYIDLIVYLVGVKSYGGHSRFLKLHINTSINTDLPGFILMELTSI
jgi:hypothetical protein